VPSSEPIGRLEHYHYSAPKLRATRYVLAGPTRAAADGVAWFLTTEHALEAYSPALDAPERSYLEAHATLAAEFAPGDGKDAVYDPADAFYVPMAGFAGVERPGPRIRIWRLAGP
jgi:hypothetical protein